MPKQRRNMLPRWAALVAVVAALLLIPLASPASAAVEAGPVCTAGYNNRAVWVSFAASKYVTAELKYTGSTYAMVRAARTSPGPWEIWNFCSYWGSGTKVTYIKNLSNGRYVSAELGYTGVDYGMLRARATSVGPWEKFVIENWGPNPSMYTIRSLANGRYVSTELGYGGSRNNMLRARATSIGNWEKYLIPCSISYQCMW